MGNMHRARSPTLRVLLLQGQGMSGITKPKALLTVADLHESASASRHTAAAQSNGAITVGATTTQAAGLVATR